MRIRVSLSSRALKGRKRAYYARWHDPATGRQRGINCGSDKYLARQRAAELEAGLNSGLWKDLQDIAWQAFTDAHVATIPGKANRAEARRALEYLGTLCSPASPKHVTYAMLELYVAKLRDRGLSVASINKHLRYMKHALRMGIKRRHLAESPFESQLFIPEDRPEPRVLTDDEEGKLLAAAKQLYGFRWEAFIRIALATAGRRSELLGLTWANVDFEGKSVLFIETKGRRDRRVPIDDADVDILRRLQAQTLAEGGPFAGMGGAMQRRWDKIVETAGIDRATLHDCRRTALTRLALHGVPMAVLQRVAGHSSISTTSTFYVGLGDGDIREAVKSARLARSLHRSRRKQAGKGKA